MAMRAKELGALGLQVNEKGQVIAKTSLLTEMESLVEEAGIKCCICLEGYKNQPNKVKWTSQACQFNTICIAIERFSTCSILNCYMDTDDNTKRT